MICQAPEVDFSDDILVRCFDRTYDGIFHIEVQLYILPCYHFKWFTLCTYWYFEGFTLYLYLYLYFGIFQVVSAVP